MSGKGTKTLCHFQPDFTILQTLKGLLKLEYVYFEKNTAELFKKKLIKLNIKKNIYIILRMMINKKINLIEFLSNANQTFNSIFSKHCCNKVIGW